MTAHLHCLFGWTPIHSPLTFSFLTSILIQALWCPWDYPSIFLPALICPKLLRCCHVRDVWPCERVSTACLRRGLSASSILSEGEQAVSRAGAIRVCRSDVSARWHVRRWHLPLNVKTSAKRARLYEWLQPVIFLYFILNVQSWHFWSILHSYVWSFLDMHYSNTMFFWSSSSSLEFKCTTVTTMFIPILWKCTYSTFFFFWWNMMVFWSGTVVLPWAFFTSTVEIPWFFVNSTIVTTILWNLPWHWNWCSMVLTWNSAIPRYFPGPKNMVVP